MATSSNDDVEHNKQSAQTSHTEVSNFSNDFMILETQKPTAPSELIPRRDKLLMWLIVAGPREQRGMVLPIHNGAIIGRHGDITWHDSRMSRQHAEFVLIDDPKEPHHRCFAIKPVKDRNGTWVNGSTIKEITALYENDVIIMGNTRFVVKVLE